VIFTPSALIEVFHHLGRESVFLTGSVGYNFYDQNSVLNRENIDLSGGVNGQFGACRATVNGSYARRQEQLQDTILTRVNDTYTQGSVGLEGACGRGFGLSPNFSFTQSWSTNSLAQLSSSDYNTTGGNAGVSYQTPNFGVLSLFGQAQTTDFTNRLVTFNLVTGHDGFETYGGGVRYSRLLGARIQGTVSVSYTAVHPYTGATTDFSGFTYSTDLTFRASSRLMLHGNFIRDVQPSNVFNSTYYVESKELVEGTYNLGSRITLNLGASDTNRDFKGAMLSRLTDLTHDELESVYGSASYRLRKIYLTLSASQTHRTANVAGLGYPDTRVGLTVGGNF
jgi:hypothetical protein